MNLLKKCAAVLAVALVSYGIGVALPGWAWCWGWMGAAVSIGAMHLIDWAEDRT